jgi:hypothetical protein
MLLITQHSPRVQYFIKSSRSLYSILRICLNFHKIFNKTMFKLTAASEKDGNICRCSTIPFPTLETQHVLSMESNRLAQTVGFPFYDSYLSRVRTISYLQSSVGIKELTNAPCQKPRSRRNFLKDSLSSNLHRSAKTEPGRMRFKKRQASKIFTSGTQSIQ